MLGPFSSVQSLSHVWLFVIPWTAAHQASLSITNSWSLPKLMSIESVMSSNHLILCHPLLLLPSIFPNIRVFSNESALHIRSINQGKLEVVKQEMARVNVSILGIRELKWTGMGELNTHDHYIYYCRQESLRRNGVAIMVNKRVRNAVLGCNSKMTEWSMFISKANHSISQ